MKIRFSVLSALALALAPLYSWAGGVAVIQSGDDQTYGRSTIEFSGDQVRIELMGAEQEGYLLMRDGSIYTVTTQGGQPFVMDLGGMMNMLGGFMEDQATLETPISDVVTVESTGRTEQVAGITGQVYNVTYIDEDGRQVTEEVVMGRHRALRELSSTLESWSRTMAEKMNTEVEDYDQTMGQLLTYGDGVLRMGEHYHLVSIDGNEPPASRFELPAAPQQMSDLGALMSGALNNSQAQPQSQTAQETAAETQGNAIGDFFNRRTQRQQDRVENRTEQEVDQATDRAVDRVIDNIFRRF